MSARAFAGEHDWYFSHCTNRVKCERIQIESLGETWAMIYCCCNNSSSAANLSQYVKGIDRGDVTQIGLALSVKWM